MLDSITFKVEGVAPLIQHNGRLGNPLDQMAKLIKETTDKKKKTDQDHRLISRLEFIGGLYTTEPFVIAKSGYDLTVTGGGNICLPLDCWEGCLVVAARRLKLGKDAQAGIMVEQDSVLNGVPSVAEILKNQERYFFTKRAKVKQSAVMRTRPIFNKWSTSVTVSYLSDVLNESQVIDIIEAVRLIEAAERLVELSKENNIECQECGGEGVIECHACGNEDVCEECNGKGILSFTEKDLQRSTIVNIARHIKECEDLITA